jgi:hypothetical protein
MIKDLFGDLSLLKSDGGGGLLQFDAQVTRRLIKKSKQQAALGD